MAVVSEIVTPFGRRNKWPFSDFFYSLVRFVDPMPLLLRQPIASTALDAHGERVSLPELKGLFEALPSELVVNDSHDMSLPSAAVARNMQLAQLESGEWAIIADVEVHDEELLSKRGGFSMAWLAGTYTRDPDREPDIQVLFNPRLFDARLGHAIAALTDDHLNVVARELKQKGLIETAILVVKFAGGAALAGFIGKVGSNVYDKLLSRLQTSQEDLRQKQNAEVVVHFLVPRHLNPFDADILIELSASQLEHLRVGALSFQDAIDAASLVPHAENAKKIVVKAAGDPPRWQLAQYEKASGMRIRI